jgi:hypothetical protein
VLAYLLHAVVLLVVPLAFITLGGLIGALAPVLALTITATGMGSASATEDLKLVMLSNLTPHDVIYGYYRAALHRLRLLWAIGVGLMPGVAISVAYRTLWVGPVVTGSATDAAVGLGLALAGGLVVTIAAAGISALACRVGAMVGVWLALEWRAQAPVMALGGLAASVILCVAANLVIPCGGFFILIVGMTLVNQIAWARAKRAVEARSGEPGLGE